jgi:glycosyltransferase involved in cell wall biosynthesis
MTNPSIVFFNGRLLPPSETFIRAQGEGLQKFTPYYVGTHRVQGLSLPPEQTLVVNQGGLIGSVEEGLFKLSGFAPKLYRELHQLNPVLVHAHFTVCGALALPLSQALKIPLIVTAYGLDVTMKDIYARSLSHCIYFQRQEALKQKTTLFIAISKFIKDKLLEKGFPSSKIVVHPIGADLDIFKPDCTIPREPVVLFVARLVEKKGCEYLIRAMSRVQATMPDVELVLIGDGPLRTPLEALAKSKLQRYHFLGVQSPQVVRDWMNRAKVFCVPSITAESGDAEGLGVVFAEAQAMGLPVVSSTNGGIPEVVANGKTGFLAPERDWENLAESILRLLKDLDLWQSFSTQGQEHVKANFDQKKQARILENIYNSVLQEEA